MRRAGQTGLIAVLVFSFVVPVRAEESGPPAPPAPPDPHPRSSPPDEGRRTLGRFAVNLGGNFVGVVSRSNLEPFVFGAWAAGTGSLVDRDVESYFLRHPHQQYARVGDFVGQAYVFLPVAGAFFVSGRLWDKPKWRATTYDLVQAMIVNGAWTLALKYTVRRPRPDGSDNLSFPSGHASDAFAWATVGAEHYGWKLGVPAYLLAGAVGVSRIQGDVHNLSDVLAGAALGVIVGRTVVRRNGGTAMDHARHISLVPAFDTHGTGKGLALSVDF